MSKKWKVKRVPGKKFMFEVEDVVEGTTVATFSSIMTCGEPKERLWFFAFGYETDKLKHIHGPFFSVKGLVNGIWPEALRTFNKSVALHSKEKNSV